MSEIKTSILREKTLDITGFTLIPVERELDTLQSMTTGDWKWLTEEDNSFSSKCIDDYAYMMFMTFKSFRPAVLLNMKTSDLVTGDKVMLFGRKWSALDSNKLICNSTIPGEEEPNLKKYEISDLKRFLTHWLFKHIEGATNDE